ncbi:glycosyltransferase family 61 protein [Azospirillum sp. TSH100]|uniref:glycosyltransferase family 61 protein n=1 Tax=Azospirillum sp. TSH100 TaxID=652764 RepID=UPI001304B970|nr:glycosyltransferase family 61 protein [Azospirillum sp. TSH100]
MNPTDLVTRAIAHHQAGQLGEAERLYETALCLSPFDFNALHCLGLVRWRSGDPQAGAALMQRAVAVNPFFDAPFINLGNLYRSLGQPETAAGFYERGVAANPGSVPLRELYCAQALDFALAAHHRNDVDSAGAWLRTALLGLAGAPTMNQFLYDLFERHIRIALLTEHRELAEACVRVKNRYDFRAVAESDIDIFTVDIHEFPDWCAAAGLPARIWQADAQPVPQTAYDEYPAYLHCHLDGLPALGAAPVGVAFDARIEVIQGFYVKDNFESFILADRRHMLRESQDSVVNGATVPLVGVTPGLVSGAIRLPRPLYRVVDIPEPAIFVRSTPNYWHFMVDVLPMLIACTRIPEAQDLPVILFDVREYQYEMLELIGIRRERIVDMRHTLGQEGTFSLYRFDRAVVPSPVSYPVAYRWLREAMLGRVRPGRGPLPRRVFLSRRNSYPKHRIANDAAVGDLLAAYGFEVVPPESLNVLETIELVAQAEIVVSPIGAGTSNHVYLPPNATWIHLNNPDFFHPESSWNIQMGTQATLIGHFSQLTGSFTGDSVDYSDRLVDRLDVPVDIDLAALARLVEEAIARL